MITAGISKVKEFEKRFADENKSPVCRELLGGYDFANPEESIKKYNINVAEAFKNCAGYCKFACDILDDMM